jgi:type I restriction enzyme M protein
MGDAYEYLIKKFADLSKKNAGEFYTPRTVVKLMVMLLDPQAGDTVYENIRPKMIQFNISRMCA